MPTLLETLAGQLAGARTARMSQNIGANQDITQKAIGAALPLLLGALAKNATNRDGADALHRAVAKDHDGSVLRDLDGYVGRPDTQTGDGILRHVLGAKRPAVEAGISKASGLDTKGVATMMASLAPLVMGMLGQQQRQQNLDSSGLAQMLQGEQQQAATSAPALGGLARLLDSDNDGQITDDLAKIGSKLLGGLFSKR
ncbi:MAG: DUF937 domain-containing protein [Gemmatimonadales bacterium]|nr:DUF937 domain-containing protein [Gemmatimonadales bacterium]